jgi:guanosine-3',5'-bis(diphosphate) 3'-pyrophosphohydrolase
MTDPAVTHSALAHVLHAATFAADKHRNQRRKDQHASPYINHPLQLAALLAVEAGVTDPAVLCAALLHDTIEDTETTAAELVQHFGREVAELVLEVTDDKALPKAVRKQLQIEHAGHASAKAKLVKLADKICNVRDMGRSPPADWEPVRVAAYYDWAEQVVGGLRGSHPVLEGLFVAAVGEARGS